MRIGIGRADPHLEADRPEAAARALTDALLGAAGLSRGGESSSAPGGNDRGEASSPLDALSRAVRAVEGENYQVVNVDLVVGGEPSRGNAGSGGRPGTEPGADQVRRVLADRLHVSPGQVSVKPGRDTPPGSMGGRGGRAVVAVALLDRIAPMDQVHSALRAGG